MEGRSVMIWTIAKKEFLENVLSYKFILTMILSFALIVMSLSIMGNIYRQRLEQYTVAVPKEGESKALKRPATLGVFARGLDEQMTRLIDIWSWVGRITVGSKQQTNYQFMLFPAPDFLYIVRVLFSLLAILFTFDAISGEKQRGTLKLSLSGPLPKYSILLGKWIGGSLGLAIPFLISITAGGMVLSFGFAMPFISDDMMRIGLIMLASIIYISAFFSLGLLVSSLTGRPTSSAIIALAVWVTLIFGLPNVGVLMARRLVKIPSIESIEQERNRLWAVEIFKAEGDYRNAWKEAKSRYVEIENQYRNRLHYLVRLSTNLSRLSPASSYLFLITALTRTGVEDNERFKDAVIRYREETFMKERKDIPRFIYTEPVLRNTLRSDVYLDFGVLLLFNVIFFMGTYMAFLRYDPR